jgi:hypothetical protein
MASTPNRITIAAAAATAAGFCRLRSDSFMAHPWNSRGTPHEARILGRARHAQNPR